MKIDTSRRLEQALALWENLNYYYRVVAERCIAVKQSHRFPMEEMYKNSDKLRKVLLGSYSSNPSDRFDFSDFSGSTEKSMHLFGNLGLLPLYLHHWTVSSRRVYHLSQNLQTLLRWTSLDNVRWSDIEWPFNSFVVSLETPIVDTNGDKFDCMLFTKIDAIDEGVVRMSDISITLFSSRLEGLETFTSVQRQNLQRAYNECKAKKVKKMMSVIDSLQPGPHATRPVRMYYFDAMKNRDMLVSESAEVLNERLVKEHQLGSYDVFDAALNIVAGLALYLGSQDADSEERTEWRRASVPGERNHRHINNTAQVCEVFCTKSLTIRDQEFISAINRQLEISGRMGMPVHWRCGYWRRPPGMGCIPMAKRSVRVSPSLVNSDLIDEFTDKGLPVGSCHRI